MISKKIDLKNTWNTRTLSTLTNKEGKHIKEHLLLRSDALNEIDEEDAKILVDEYHLKRVIDLRCLDEAQRKPDKRIENVLYIANPIMPNNKVGISKKGNDKEDFYDFIKILKSNGIASSIAYMENVYKEVIQSPFSLQAYQQFFKYLLDPIDGATLWHCSAGKDRAGLATMLTLYILDFKTEDILSDYLATNHFYQPKVEELLKVFGMEYEEILWSVFGVREEYVEIIKSSISETYQSLEHYIEMLGIGEFEKNRLKELYLED